MTARDKATLKSYFETNDTPSESQFADQIDTFFGEWVDYSTGSSIVGWSSFENRAIFYKEDSELVFVKFYLEGASNSVLANFTLPFPRVTGTTSIWDSHLAQDNGGTFVWGSFYVAVSDNVVNLYSAPLNEVWTSTGTKTCIGQFWYKKA